MTIEDHPLRPFLPAGARILFLGSFPPPRERWSMEWFYPNWINDFWRIQGLLAYGDAHYFEAEQEHRFDRERVEEYCRRRGLAFFDTAQRVCRHRDNAADAHLEVILPTDVLTLLRRIPECRTVATTGGKATDELLRHFLARGLNVCAPRLGESTAAGALTWWRMPSTSRAYPMRMARKAEYYRRLMESVGVLPTP